MYNRYQGNTGKVVRVDDSPPARKAAPPPAQPEHREQRPAVAKPRPAAAPSRLGKSLDGLLKKLDPSRLEFEDILLMLILYLLYRDSGDEELLIMLGAMLLL